MENRPLVVVLGDSLLMEGVTVSLADCSQLSLFSVDSNDVDIWQRVNSLDPDVVVFELEIPHSPLILSLLKERPGILLVGLDLECNRVIVLNSRQHSTQTMHDLYQIVEAEVGKQVRFSYKKEPDRSPARTRSESFPASSG
jgi:DNA-binding NarL/FixJ family response regulator